jgi:nitrite reductase/ring-hydroxylating ferredoxin subunit
MILFSPMTNPEPNDRRLSGERGGALATGAPDNRPAEVENEFRVCPVDEIPDGGGVLGSAGDLQLGVFRRGDQLYAYENRCAHQGGPVCTGELLGRTVQVLNDDKEVVAEIFDEDDMHLVCPWHGWEYELATGELACDRRFRLRRFDVTVRDGIVFVRP